MQVVKTSSVSSGSYAPRSLFGVSITQGVVDGMIANGLSAAAIAGIYGVSLGVLKSYDWWQGRGDSEAAKIYKAKKKDSENLGKQIAALITGREKRAESRTPKKKSSGKRKTSR